VKDQRSQLQLAKLTAYRLAINTANFLLNGKDVKQGLSWMFTNSVTSIYHWLSAVFSSELITKQFPSKG
jgi:hypothetical protein